MRARCKLRSVKDVQKHLSLTTKTLSAATECHKAYSYLAWQKRQGVLKPNKYPFVLELRCTVLSRALRCVSTLRFVWGCSPLSLRLDVEERRNGPKHRNRGFLRAQPNHILVFLDVQSGTTWQQQRLATALIPGSFKTGLQTGNLPELLTIRPYRSLPPFRPQKLPIVEVRKGS